MRPEPNNEIDLLLRQLARRDGAPVSEIEEQHFDADELNSYVANALPAAARTRYTEHLADCSSCRKLVVQLSAAQGPVAVQQSAPVVAPSGLKSFLASLFSPMVLRFAVPALGLIVIAVVGIVVLRQDQRGTDVAQVSDEDQNRPVLQTPAETAVTTPNAPVANNGQASQRPVVAPVTKDVPARVANQPADTIATADAPPPAPKAAPVEEQAQRAPETDKEKKAETAQPAVAPDAAKKREDEAVKTEARKYDAVTATPSASVTSENSPRKAESRPAKMGQAAGAGTARGNVSSAPRDSSRSRDEAPNAYMRAETRSVAGRRFRKSDGVWIDTAYNSSSAVTHVARGSEQYRALVADEPSIRAIAEELDGQIIVVWKGRTYRIR